MHRRTHFLAGLAAAGLRAAAARAADATPKEGDKAPDVQLSATQSEKALPDAKGKTLKLSDLKGKKNVVLFLIINP
jgi:cytochrome oxidase Cu insertion factor (SCO1/SenC/PrrC family)